MQYVRDNITTVVSTISGVAFIIGTAFVIDERYAHAGEINGVKGLVTKMQIQQQVDNSRLRIDLIDDRIFYLEQKPNKTNQDEATLKRLERQREDAVRELNNLGKQ